MKRSEASKQGLTIYEADKPCKYGHSAMRYVSSGTCVGCGAKRRADLQRQLANDAAGWEEFSVRVPREVAEVVRDIAERFRTGTPEQRAYLELQIHAGLARGAAPMRRAEDLVPAAFRGASHA